MEEKSKGEQFETVGVLVQARGLEGESGFGKTLAGFDLPVVVVVLSPATPLCWFITNVLGLDFGSLL